METKQYKYGLFEFITFGFFILIGFALIQYILLTASHFSVYEKLAFIDDLEKENTHLLEKARGYNYNNETMTMIYNNENLQEKVQKLIIIGEKNIKTTSEKIDNIIKYCLYYLATMFLLNIMLKAYKNYAKIEDSYIIGTDILNIIERKPLLSKIFIHQSYLHIKKLIIIKLNKFKKIGVIHNWHLRIVNYE